MCAVKYPNTEPMVSDHCKNVDGKRCLEIDLTDTALLAYITEAGKAVTLDAVIAQYTGVSGDVALNYDRIVFTGGATTVAYNITYTLADRAVADAGQTFEIILTGTITTGDIVVTITTPQLGSSYDVYTMDSALEGFYLRWNGYYWQPLTPGLVVA